MQNTKMSLRVVWTDGHHHGRARGRLHPEIVVLLIRWSPRLGVRAHPEESLSLSIEPRVDIELDLQIPVAFRRGGVQ